MEHSVFAKKNQNLDPGNYNNQFEVDDAKSKLQFILSWKWSPEAGHAYLEQNICGKSPYLPFLLAA